MTSITFYGAAGEIGGNKILVEDDTGRRIFLDFGRRMGYAGRYYAEFVQPRSKTGAIDLIRLGVLPKVDGIYRRCMVDFMSICPELGDDADVEREAFEGAPDYWCLPDTLSYEEYLSGNGAPFVDGVFVSHAHFDHIQDISYLSPEIPVYCTEKTELVSRIISDISHSGADIEFYYYSTPEVSLKGESHKTLFPGTPDVKKIRENGEILLEKVGEPFDVETTHKPRKYITLGDCEHTKIGDMDIKLIETDHSLIGSCAYLLKTGGKTILYTGDIRFHGRPDMTLESFCAKVDEPVDVMVIEGTRIDSEKIMTEQDVLEDIAEKVKEVKGLVMVDFGWKDVVRFNTIREAARRNGRVFVIVPRLAYLLYELHRAYPEEYEDPRNMDNVRVYLKRKGGLMYSKADYKKTDAGYLEEWGRNSLKIDRNIIRIKERVMDDSASDNDLRVWELAAAHLTNGIRAYEIREKPEGYIVMLSFWNMNELFALSPPGCDMTGSRFIKAMCEPFNDEMIIDEQKIINWLERFNIGYECEPDENGKKTLERSHVSGHASRPELAELIERISPNMIIPVHTEHPETFMELHDNVLLPKIGEKYTI